MPVAWQDVVTFYDHLTLHLVPGPRSLSYFVPFILMYVSLLIPPSTLSHNQLRCLILPFIYAMQANIWIRHGSFDVISVSGMLTAFMLIGWYDVRRDFKHVRRLADGQPQSSPGTTVQIPFTLEAYPASLSARCRWVGSLFLSLRLTDWHIGVHSHDATQPCPIKPFEEFVSETVAHSIFCYALLDVTSTYMAKMPCTVSPTSYLPASTAMILIRPATHLLHFYAALALLTALVPHLVALSVLLVIPSLRYSTMISPLMWSSHFGPVSSVYSSLPGSPVRGLGLRAFWGTFWHQNMRHVASTPGIAMAHVFGLRKGSKLRHMVVATSGFFWSGVIHMGVAPLEPVNTRLTGWQMKLLVASFFWLQIVGIGLEDLAEHLLEVYGRRRIAMGTKPTGSDTARSKGGIEAHVVRNLVKKCAICLWTATFLAATGWWTVFPVGCEMNWWSLKLLPFYASDQLLAQL